MKNKLLGNKLNRRLASEVVSRIKQAVVDNHREIIRLVNKLKRQQGKRWVVPLNIITQEVEELHRLLARVGFWRFFCTNSGRHIIYRYQVVAYLYCGGYQAYLNGFTAPYWLIHVHHRNGNSLDDRWENLVFLSVDDHHKVSMAQRGVLGAEVYTPRASVAGGTPFNQHGDEVRDKSRFLQEEIAAALRTSAKWIDRLAARARRVGVVVKDKLIWAIGTIKRAKRFMEIDWSELSCVEAWT